MSDIILNVPSDKPVTLVTNKEQLHNFIEDCKKIYEKSKIDKNVTFCGIDLEYNMNWKNKERYIALIQVILIDNSTLYNDIDHIKPIYIFDPHKIDSLSKELLIKYLFCSKIVKIFHGSDSLDYVHIFREILNNKKKRFMKFINYSVDTRFLCDISKQLLNRIGLNKEISKKCSIYNALYDHDIVDKNLFDKLNLMSSKINYNKTWTVDNLTQTQLIYSSYDVVYLYDLLKEITARILNAPKSNIDQFSNLDTISIVNRLYRYHMINKLGLIKISNNCKNIVSDYKMSKQNIDDIDQKIMDTKITDNVYNYKNKKHQLTITFDDILGIDTIRKNILYCLRIYQIDKNIDKVDDYFKNSKYFKLMKGYQTILDILNIIKSKANDRYHNVECGIK